MKVMNENDVDLRYSINGHSECIEDILEQILNRLENLESNRSQGMSIDEYIDKAVEDQLSKAYISVSAELLRG